MIVFMVQDLVLQFVRDLGESALLSALLNAINLLPGTSRTDWLCF